MSIFNFRETNESNNEVQETKENVDNKDRIKNQILKTPEAYKDGFSKKLDDAEKAEAKTENSDNKESVSEGKNGEKSKLNEMLDKRKSFVEQYRVDSPTQEEQAETSKKWQERADKNATEGENNEEDEEPQHGDGGQRTRDLER